MSEHSEHFAPQRDGESEIDFLIRALGEHRQSHVAWADHLTAHPGCTCANASENTLGNDPVSYQRDAVSRYDEMIRITEKLAAIARGEVRAVMPPRVGGAA